MERATLQARGAAPRSWWQNYAKSWHLGISWELNKALNLSLFTHNFFLFFFFLFKVYSRLYSDILTSSNQDYFFVKRDSICLYLLFKEILKIMFLIIKVIYCRSVVQNCLAIFSWSKVCSNCLSWFSISASESIESVPGAKCPMSIGVINRITWLNNINLFFLCLSFCLHCYTNSRIPRLDCLETLVPAEKRFLKVIANKW